MKHKDLARSLNLSPQQLAELFSGRNQPTGSQVLAIIEFLKTNDMTDQPKTLSAAKDQIEALTAELARLKSQPAKTTAKIIAPAPAAAATLIPAVVAKAPAITMNAMEAEIARAHAARTANLSSLPIELQTADQLRAMLNAEKDATKRFSIYQQIKSLGGPKVDGTQAPAFDPATLPGWEPLKVVTPPPPKRLPESANTPVKIQAILDVTVLDPDLLSMLGNPVHTPLQRGMIYDEVKKRRALEGTNC